MRSNWSGIQPLPGRSPLMFSISTILRADVSVVEQMVDGRRHVKTYAPSRSTFHRADVQKQHQPTARQTLRIDTQTFRLIEDQREHSQPPAIETAHASTPRGWRSSSNRDEGEMRLGHLARFLDVPIARPAFDRDCHRRASDLDASGIDRDFVADDGPGAWNFMPSAAIVTALPLAAMARGDRALRQGIHQNPSASRRRCPHRGWHRRAWRSRGSSAPRPAAWSQPSIRSSRIAAHQSVSIPNSTDRDHRPRAAPPDHHPCRRIGPCPPPASPPTRWQGPNRMWQHLDGHAHAGSRQHR